MLRQRLMNIEEVVKSTTPAVSDKKEVLPDSKNSVDSKEATAESEDAASSKSQPQLEPIAS